MRVTTLEERVDEVRRRACEVIRPKLEPDADWEPVVMMFVGDAAVETGLLRFENEVEKALLYGIAVPARICELRIDAVVLVNTAWMVQAVPGQERELLSGPRPAVHPQRIEVLCVTGLTADESVQWVGRIQRRKKRAPVVWPDRDNDRRGASLDGAVMEPLKAALQAVKEEGE